MKFQLILLQGLVAICSSKLHTNFVIVGGTGDLARKYLWDSALELFAHNANENTTFAFYAAARIPENVGEETIQDILDDVQCDSDDAVCHKLRASFVGNVKYVQLKTTEQYHEFCQNFTLSSDEQKEGKESKLIFYLSIPSSAYESVSKSVHDSCRHDDRVELKVVLEKPFGSNKESAVHQVPYFFGYKTEIFSFPSNSKNLDPSYKMDLIHWDR